MIWVLLWTGFEIINLGFAIAKPTLGTILALTYTSIFLGAYVTSYLLVKKTVGELIAEEVKKHYGKT